MDYLIFVHNLCKRKKIQLILVIFSVFIIIVFIYNWLGFNVKIKSNKFGNPIFTMIDDEFDQLEFDSINSNNVTG